MRQHRCACCLLACLLCGRGSAGPWDADEQRLQQAGVRSDAPSLLKFFRQRSSRVGQKEVRDLIRQLGMRSFAARERASKALVECGARAVAQLLPLTQSGDPEVRRRVADCLRQIEADTPPAVVTSAARLLADRKPPGAAEALLDFLPG